MTPEEWDKLANELLVAGGVFMVLDSHPGFRCEIVLDVEGQATTSLHVWADWMKSRYRVTVTLDPEEENGTQPVPGAAHAAAHADPGGAGQGG
jgi:hypothetical protein